MTSGSKGVTKVRTASRSTGGVVISDSSRTPVSASCSVRGIGVADSVSTWTSARSSFSRSLWATPKCCSSSTMSEAEVAERRSSCRAARGCRRRCRSCRRRCPALTCFSSAAGTKREACAILTGKPRKRSEKVLKCWRASSVVGTTTATCLPAIAVTKAARSATSVLPKPTSPQTSRSIGRPAPRSSMHVVDRALLVLGLLVGEAGGELVVEPFRRGQRAAPRAGRARRRS